MTDLAEFIVKVHVPVPVQPPEPHPAKMLGAEVVADSVTIVPEGIFT